MCATHAQENVDGDFQPLSAAELMSQDVDELKRSVADRKEEAENREKDKERVGRVPTQNQVSSPLTEPHIPVGARPSSA